MGLTFVMERSHGLHRCEGGLGLNLQNYEQEMKLTSEIKKNTSRRHQSETTQKGGGKRSKYKPPSFSNYEIVI